MHNEILKFHPSPKIYTVFCVDEHQIWLKIILMENVQLSLQQDKALTEPCHAEVLAWPNDFALRGSKRTAPGKEGRALSIPAAFLEKPWRCRRPTEVFQSTNLS